MTKLTKATFIIAASFALNKILAIVRQLIIARQFGLSAELDVFNVANNVPDMLYAMISGGALAMAVIPVLSEVLSKQNREAAWGVFSRVANIAFLFSLLLSLLVAIFAEPLVSSPLGIAPGFTAEQQDLVVELMRLNLIATLIFSMAGLLIAGLQANQHFLLPAIAPILYNIGQIFGAIVLAPTEGYIIGGFQLPAFGLGIHGIVYGVLIGSALFFVVQIPGLVMLKFRWTARLDPNQADVKKILRMLAPRVASMLCYQLTFIARDNIASYLSTGAPTALTYGWMIQQVPETLIGTAIGTALLPTISELFALEKMDQFKDTIERVTRVLIALSLPAGILLAVALPPFLDFAFGFGTAETEQLLWVTRAFLAGLVGHSLLELGARVFFAQQNAFVPFLGALLNLVLYVLYGLLLAKPLDAPGVALADALAFTAQAAFLLITFKLLLAKKQKEKAISRSILWRALTGSPAVKQSFLRAAVGSAFGAAVIWAVLTQVNVPLSPLFNGLLASVAGLGICLPFIWKEVRILLHL